MTKFYGSSFFSYFFSADVETEDVTTDVDVTRHVIPVDANPVYW